MGMQVRVSGGADLTSVRRNLRMLGDANLSRQMSQGFQRAVKPLKPAVQKSAADLLPKRGGYAELMSKSVRFRTTTRERRGSASLVIRVFGEGEGQQRDVAAVNKGTLRHPVFGRSRTIRRGPRAGTRVANKWAEQKVHVGFVDRPVDRLAPDIAREMQAVVEYIAGQITRG